MIFCFHVVHFGMFYPVDCLSPSSWHMVQVILILFVAFSVGCVGGCWLVPGGPGCHPAANQGAVMQAATSRDSPVRACLCCRITHISAADLCNLLCLWYLILILCCVMQDGPDKELCDINQDHGGRPGICQPVCTGASYSQCGICW